MKIFAGTILTLFLGLMFVSLFQMSGPMGMSHEMSGGHNGMSGMSAMSDCPFMTHGEALCPMSLSDHIGVWKSLFSSLIPSTFALLVAFGIAAFVISSAPHLVRTWTLHLVSIHWHQLRHATYTYTVRPYQELFSRGILHPKLF